MCLKFLTDANDFLNLDTGGVDLFGKFPDGLVRVLVRERIDVYPHSCRETFARSKGRKEVKEKR